jgi:hypothetical protein
MRPSNDGKKLVWCQGYNPKLVKKRLQVNHSLEGKKSKRPKNISTILKGFLKGNVTESEFKKLPDNVRKALEDKLGRGLTRGDIAAFVLMGKAMEGDIAAFKEIVDRTEGKAVQRTENKNLNVNYTDFIKGLAGFDDEPEEEEDDSVPDPFY